MLEAEKQAIREEINAGLEAVQARHPGFEFVLIVTEPVAGDCFAIISCDPTLALSLVLSTAEQLGAEVVMVPNGRMQSRN